MKFTLHRNHVLASTLGHAIEFKKGVPTEVPKLLRAEAIAIGAICDEELTEEEQKDAVPTDPEKRTADMVAAIELILTRADREDFTAGGLPHIRAMSRIVGYSVSANERDEAWRVFQEAAAEEEDKTEAKV